MGRELVDYLILGIAFSAFLGAVIYARLNTTERRYRRFERREDAKAGKSRNKGR
jgi:hypothetical protein